MHADDWRVIQLIRQSSTLSKPLVSQLPHPLSVSSNLNDMEKSEYFKEAIDPELSISYQTGRRKASLARMPDQIRRIVLFCCVCVLGFLTYVAKPSIWSIDGKSATPVLQDPSGSECPQASPISSSLHADLLKLLEKEFASEEYKAKAYETLGGAVRIP